MPVTEWCDICLKYGMCYMYDYPGKKTPHPEHDEDEIAPLRQERDWTRIAEEMA